MEFDVKKFTFDHFVEWILYIYLPFWKIDVYSRMDSDFYLILWVSYKFLCLIAVFVCLEAIKGTVWFK